MSDAGFVEVGQTWLQRAFDCKLSLRTVHGSTPSASAMWAILPLDALRSNRSPAFDARGHTEAVEFNLMEPLRT